MPNVRKRRNTADAKREYIQSDLSIREIGKLYKGIKGCSPQNLRKISMVEKWVAKREKFRTKLEEKTDEKTIEELSDRNAFDRGKLVNENVASLEKIKKIIVEQIGKNLVFSNLRQAIQSMVDVVDMENKLLESTFDPGQTDDDVTELQINITRKGVTVKSEEKK